MGTWFDARKRKAFYVTQDSFQKILYSDMMLDFNVLDLKQFTRVNEAPPNCAFL